MKKILVAVLIVVVSVAGALFGLTFIDVNAYKSEIAALSEEYTGRKLELVGPLEVGFSLTPTILANDVRFGNAPWASDPDMLEADRVAMRLSLLRLILGEIDIQQVDVKGASLHLEMGADGVGNWVLAQTTGGESESGDAISTSQLPITTLEDVRVTYRSARRGDKTEILLTRAEIDPLGKAIRLSLTGDVNSNAASASAVIAGDAQSFRIEKLELEYGDISLNGQLSGSRSGSSVPIVIDGELAATEVDLTVFKDETGAADGQEGLFSKTPLPFDTLSVLNGEVDIAIDSLVYQDLVFTDFHTALALKDGVLTAPVFATYGERRIEASISAANTSSPRATIELSAPGFEIGTFLEEVGATDLIEVDGHIGFDLSASGKSPADIAGSLTGKIDVATGRGSVHSSAFEWIAKDLIWALIPKGGESGVADLTCFIGELDFQNGVGDLSTLALVTTKIRTSASGNINLRDETLDIRLDPRPNDPGLLSLATPVNVSGSLRSPSVRPDAGALLGEIALAVGAGVLTGGIGAVLPLVSAEHFDADEAGACLEMLGTGPSATPAEEKGVLDRSGEDAGSVIEGVGDALTSPFK